MEAKQQLEQSVREQQIRESLNMHWRASAAGDLDTEHDIYDDDAICVIPSQASESSGEAICRPSGVIIRASRQASTSSAFSEAGISGSRNIQSRTRGDQHTR